MPQFIPKQSGPHRIACIALYRALLFQCSRLELPIEYFRGPINPIKHQIRKQFRRNRNETSAGFVVAALKVGYEAENLLRSAGDGDVFAFSKVISLLIDIQSEGDADRIRLALNPPPPKLPFRKPEPYPGASRVLESRPRPLSELSGRRHVPVLTSANNIPFLRIKKPQSPFLNRVLNDKIKQRQKWLDHIDNMDSAIVWAQNEDVWENLVAKEGVATDRGLWYARKGAVTNVPSWRTEIEATKRGMWARLNAVDRKSRKISKQMMRIVDEERKLFEKERRERRMSRRSSTDSNEPSDTVYSSIGLDPSSGDSK